MISLLILSCECLFLSTAALGWSRSTPTPKVPNLPLEVHEDRFKSGLTPSELDAIFLHVDALDSYTRKPDCFRRAAGLVRGQCSELEMDEDARVKAAIQMTLCELATARHHSAPLECSLFSDALESGLVDVLSASQGNCVEAISRSAQYWSSYSGYLREVPQLCYAFRRWNDIDTARDVYRNATLEKLALVQIISKREHVALESLTVLNAHLEEMRIILEHMRESGASIDFTSNEIAARFASGFDNTVGLLKHVVSEIQQQGYDHFLTAVSRVDSALEEVVERHAIALMTLLPAFSASLTSSLDDISSLIRQQNNNVLEVASEMDRTWRSLSVSFVNMHHSISHLVHVTTSATDALLLHTNSAVAAHSLQNDTNQAAMELADVIFQLRNVTHAELQWINGTGTGMRQRMSKWDEADWSWGWEVAAWLARVVWRVDMSAIELVGWLTHFRVIFYIGSIFVRLVQAMLSSWMSCFFVLLISSRKRLLRISAPAQSTTDSHSPVVSHSRLLDPGVRKQFGNSAPYPSSYHYSSIPRTRRISRIPDRLCHPSPVP